MSSAIRKEGLVKSVTSNELRAEKLTYWMPTQKPEEKSLRDMIK